MSVYIYIYIYAHSIDLDRFITLFCGTVFYFFNNAQLTTKTIHFQQSPFVQTKCLLFLRIFLTFSKLKKKSKHLQFLIWLQIPNAEVRTHDCGMLRVFVKMNVMLHDNSIIVV